MSDTEETFTDNKSKDQIINVLCIECNRETRHRVTSSLDKKGSHADREEGWSMEWTDDYQIVQCQGCQTVSFRHLNWFSESDDLQYGEEDGKTERLYPKRDKNSLKAKALRNAPTVLRRIYGEVIESYNNECLILCAAGLRAMVEGICAQQGITEGQVTITAANGTVTTARKPTLEGKISGLYEKGILTLGNAEVLHQHRYLGNEAVHELKTPSSDELRLAIEIVEHVVEQLYEIPQKALALKRTIAERKK